MMIELGILPLPFQDLQRDFICECDKKLAMDLREHEFTWNIYHHQKWGGFEKESCRIQGRFATNHSSDKKCCGTYPNR